MLQLPKKAPTKQLASLDFKTLLIFRNSCRNFCFLIIQLEGFFAPHIQQRRRQCLCWFQQQRIRIQVLQEYKLCILLIFLFFYTFKEDFLSVYRRQPPPQTMLVTFLSKESCKITYNYTPYFNCNC